MVEPLDPNMVIPDFGFVYRPGASLVHRLPLLL